jgi:integrase
VLPIAVSPAIVVKKAANGRAVGGIEPPGPTCRPAEQAVPVRHTNIALFDAYVLDKQPAKTTISRWRAVFAVLDALPEPLDTQDAAQRWLDGLKTPERSAKTVRDCWLAAARTAFRWAKRRRLVLSNPFEGCVVEVPRKVETRETGRAFTESEARTVLQGANAVRTVAIGTRGWAWAACRRWVPWLCAYMGCRPAEATQMRTCDVDLARKTARITREAGTVKTGRVRVVPLHDHVVEMGFLEFAQRVKAAIGPRAPLFYRQPRGPSRNPLYRGRP